MLIIILSVFVWVPIAETKVDKYFVKTNSIERVGDNVTFTGKHVRYNKETIYTISLNCKSWKYVILENPTKIYTAYKNSAMYWAKEYVCNV